MTRIWTPLRHFLALFLIGFASWYGEEARGRTMANGRPFNPRAMTCASWDFPLGTFLKVTHGDQVVIVQVTDRGPNKRLNRRLDLSEAAFAKLASPDLGVIQVEIQPIDNKS